RPGSFQFGNGRRICDCESFRKMDFNDPSRHVVFEHDFECHRFPRFLLPNSEVYILTRMEGKGQYKGPL
ncbi:MAG: hypothetical protein RI953_1790, partial [Pseudomonadota bacterium]